MGLRQGEHSAKIVFKSATTVTDRVATSVRVWTAALMTHHHLIMYQGLHAVIGDRNKVEPFIRIDSSTLANMIADAAADAVTGNEIDTLLV